ncbi:Putative fluoride ion transporter CrcB [Microbacterium oleivorans]|nr:CrcB family protein [Microbacterium oleivorans]AZS45038.1 Putative fluoride ion transporter CrcB [Microbacterium oleivorans]
MTTPRREPELPIDSDPTSTGSPPVHLAGSSILLVLLGGTAGTAAREGLSLAIPAVGGIPVAIFAINIVGALFLGALLESLARRGADVGRRRSLRLLLGTGFAGGFTTYSALAVDSGLLLTGGDPLGGVLYALSTVVVGALATVAGIALAAAHHRRAVSR